MKKIISSVVNIGLVMLLAGMFLLPVAMVHVASDVLSVPPTVAGAQQGNNEITVLPNFFDFNDHVSFNPQQHGFGYADELTLTSFRSQLATYHKLYTVFNRSSEQITVRGVIGEKPEPSMAYRQMVLTLAKNGQSHSAVIVEGAAEGDISLVVSDASAIEGAEHVIVGDSILPVLQARGKMFTTDPLTKSIAAQTAVYRGGIFIQDGKVYRSRSEDVLLAPGESLSVNVYITGRSDVDSQSVVIPFFVTTVQDN